MVRMVALNLLAFASVVAAGESVCTYQGVELRLLSIERAKTYLDLKVKNERKHDLVIVRVSAAWNSQAKRLLVKDSEINLVDASGKRRRCALKFIQAHAPQDLSPGMIEIPFQVEAGAALKELRIGKSALDLSSATASPAPSVAPPAAPAPPR